jgi:hypothetical protein
MENSSPDWLLLLVQLPSTPSSARVALWRQLRANGATAVVNGAWVLPHTAANAEFFEQLRDNALGQGGTGFVLRISAPSADVDDAFVRCFRADRSREYDEFAERCTALLDEIGKETGAGKFTYAEMEESEQDLEKLARWLAKIQARDFFPDNRKEQSAAMLTRCRTALRDFAEAVYAAEGVQAPAPESPLAFQQAQAVDGREAIGTVHQRVDVEGVDPVPPLGRQPARVHQDGGQRVAVPGRLAAQAVEDAEVVELGDQLGGVRGGERRQPPADPPEHLHEHPAEADGHHRAELGLAADADERLAVGLEHRLDGDQFRQVVGGG